MAGMPDMESRDNEVGNTPTPAPPTDHAADAIFGTEKMAECQPIALWSIWQSIACKRVGTPFAGTAKAGSAATSTVWSSEPKAKARFAEALKAGECRRSMPANGIGSGLSGAELGLRLRYAIKREFAPYIGVSWERKVGTTARFARTAGDRVQATSLVFGIRTWF